jgi:ABC-type Fe3+ transport system permease subunit
MAGIRPHLEQAQLALMEAAAQARINQDRAIYRVSDGHIKPALQAASVLATISTIQAQVEHLINSGSHGNQV